MFNPFRSDPGRREKIKLNFYFHFFMVPQKVLHMSFWGNKKKCENKNLSSCLFQYNFLKYMKQEGLTLSLRRPLSYRNQSTDQRTGFYMITISVMRELKKELIDSINSFMIFFQTFSSI